MIVSKETVWVIMTKCRKYIAKGTPRNRYLVAVDDPKDKKRYLTYTSQGKAESAFTVSGFYTYNIKDFPYDTRTLDKDDYLEAVECEMIIKTID